MSSSTDSPQVDKNGSLSPQVDKNDSFTRIYKTILSTLRSKTFIFFYCSLLLWLFGLAIFPWAFQYPKSMVLPISGTISHFTDWLVNEADLGLFTFKEFTRAIAWLVELPSQLVSKVLVTGFSEGFGSNAVLLWPPISWISIVLLFFLLGYYIKGLRLSLLVGFCFLYLAVFGQWESAMVTLSSILIAMPLAAIGGLLLGIMAFKIRWIDASLRPILDLMQTVPVFSYLVPILFLFGFGPTSAIFATIIYAMPPMIRITTVALREVPEELDELGRMSGCTNLQILRKIYLPTATPSLMIGVNQVIMLSLNMVIIASMIGAGGLGYDVLTALRRLDIGGGVESGLAIVVLAIALDRLSQAFAKKSVTQDGPLSMRATCLIAMAIGFFGSVGSLQWEAIHSYPKAWELSFGTSWDDMVSYININYYDQLEGLKYFILLNFMLPTKAFLLGLPWPAVIIGLAMLAYRLGGSKLMLICTLLSVFIVVTGLWPQAMITVYLISIAVAISFLIGMPIAILTSNNQKLWNAVEIAIDTLQTLPSFVYLIPVIMLFQIGDFSAIIAIVAYSIAAAIRYVGHGLQQVDPQMVESGIVSGCTRWQLLWKIRLRLALPQLLLGLNQTVLLALSMLVITALVGTKDLGQETFIALTKADTGRGITAGLCVAALAIILDRLIHAAVSRVNQKNK